MELDLAVDISVEIQPTHTFDFNTQDALYHSALKRQIRKQGFPKNNEELKEKFNKAVAQIDERRIQRGFIRAYSRDKKGDEDSSLVPLSLSAWYEDDNPSSDQDVAGDLHMDPKDFDKDTEG